VRFYLLIEAVKTTGLMPLGTVDGRWTNSREVFGDYRQRLKSIADLRTATDHDFVVIGDYDEFEAVSRMKFQPEDGLHGLLRDVPLYEVISKVQALLHEKRRSGIAFLYDSILNLSNTNAPAYANYFDPHDFRLAGLSAPFNIFYRNGSIGRSMSLPVLAAQAFHSAIGTYALYALAFEDGELQTAPWRLAATINFSGETPPVFFGRILQRRLDELNEPARLGRVADRPAGDSIILGDARVATVALLQDVASDWSAYQRIVQAEGHMPVTIELKEDFLRNHTGLDRHALDLVNQQSTLCYLQQQCRLDDGESIGLKVHLIDEPSRLLRLGLMAPCRVQLSGKLMSRAFRDDCGPWLDAARGMPLSILLDADADEIFEMLAPAWEWVTWQPLQVEGARATTMVAYPIGVSSVPDFAIFRPCAPDGLEAVARALRPFAFPAIVKELGHPIFGMSDAQRNQVWRPPEFLIWTLRRYFKDTARFDAICRRSA